MALSRARVGVVFVRVMGDVVLWLRVFGVSVLCEVCSFVCGSGVGTYVGNVFGINMVYMC